MWRGARNTPPWHTVPRGPGSCTRHTGRGKVSGLGLLKALRGQRRRHSCLVPRARASLSSRDASRSARRKRTGCVEPYDQGPPARPRYRRGPSTLKGRGTEGLRSTDLPIGRSISGHGGPRGRRLTNRPYQVDRRGSILEVATFSD